MKKTPVFWAYTIQIGTFIVLCLTNGYYTATLAAMGYSERMVGVLYSVSGLVCLVLEPLIGLICDRTGKFRGIFIALILQFTCSVFLFIGFSNVIAVAVLFAISVGASMVIIGYVDNWIKLLSATNPKIDFPRVRGFGSFVYAFASLGMGYLLRIFGFPFSRWIVLLGSVLAVAVALLLPDPPREEGLPKISIKQSAKYLAANHRFALFVFVMLLTLFSSLSTIAFLPHLVDSLGGGSVDIGYVYLISTLGEALAMLFTSKLVKRFGSAALLTVGILGHFIRCVCMALSPNLAVLYCASALQAISWGITLPVFVIYIFEIVDEKYFSTASMLSLSLTFGLAQLVGGWIYGEVTTLVGVKQMLLLMSIPALVAFVIFALATRKYKKEGMA